MLKRPSGYVPQPNMKYSHFYGTNQVLAVSKCESILTSSLTYLLTSDEADEDFAGSCGGYHLRDSARVGSSS